MTDEKKAEIERISTSKAQLNNDVVSDRFKNLNAIGLVADSGACGYYRVINPLHLLKRLGANVRYEHTVKLGDFREADVILAPRQFNPDAYEMLRMLQWEGKKIIFEIDDDLHHVLPSSPAYTVFHPGAQSLEFLEKGLSNAHGVTVTTQELKQVYSRFNSNIEVVPNFIDFSQRDWNVDVTWKGGYPVFEPKPIVKPEKWKGKTVILWSGGSSHKTDLDLLFKDIGQILKNYPETLFAYYGAKELFDASNKPGHIPADRVEFLETRHFIDHPQGLFGADIGLAPIQGCEFNIHKSCLKVIEGFSAGMAMVASCVGPYARLYSEYPESFLMVGQSDACYADWYSAIEELVKDENLRNSLQVQGRKLAIEKFSLENNIDLWPKAWGQLITNAEKGLLGPDDKQVYKPIYGLVGRNNPCPCGSGLRYKNCSCFGAWG